jgi:hypothetical protein
LLNLGTVQYVTFRGESSNQVEDTLIEAIPVIQETGWKVLRPASHNSQNLIAYKPDELKTGEFLKG